MSQPDAYRSMVKSTGIIGGSTVLNLLIGMSRTKVTAVLLGPEGTGLIGLYSMATALVGSVTNLNITYAAVRRMAEAWGKGDVSEAAKIFGVLRTLAWATGLLGILAQCLLSAPLSRFTFGDASRAGSLAVLSTILLLQALATSWQSTLQATRRVSAFAKQSVAGASVSAVTGVGLIAWLRFDGIVPQLIAVALGALVIAYLFGRKADVPVVRPQWPDVKRIAPALVGVGASITVTGLVTAGTTYVVASMISNRLGIRSAGLYQAAWSLSGLFAGVILNAMTADYYPRLAAVGSSREKCSRLVNQQAEVTLLLAMPGILGTLVLGRLVLLGFYSTEYLPAYGLMKWMLVAVALRVVAWCMAYVLLAREDVAAFVGTETALNLTQVLMTWLLIDHFGVAGVAVSVVAAYGLYGTVLYTILNRKIGLRPSRELLAELSWLVPASLVVWLILAVGHNGVPLLLAVCLLMGISLVCATRSARQLGFGAEPREQVAYLRRALRARRGGTVRSSGDGGQEE